MSEPMKWSELRERVASLPWFYGQCPLNGETAASMLKSLRSLLADLDAQREAWERREAEANRQEATPCQPQSDTGTSG